MVGGDEGGVTEDAAVGEMRGDKEGLKKGRGEGGRMGHRERHKVARCAKCMESEGMDETREGSSNLQNLSRTIWRE